MPYKDREFRLAYQKAHSAKVYDTRKREEYWRKYLGMPEPTRPRPEECECCGKLETRLRTNGARRRLHLDHDHETGAFRGWLCSHCNTAIGRLGDNLRGVRNAVRYLENHYGHAEQTH